MANYVNNKQLREMIGEYNRTNIEDDGSWLPRIFEANDKKI